MRWHWLFVPLKWSLFLGLAGGLLFGLFVVREKMRADLSSEEKTGPPPPSKNGSLSLEEEEAERYGLEVEPARSVQWYEQVSVSGRVVPNRARHPRCVLPSPVRCGRSKALPGPPWDSG